MSNKIVLPSGAILEITLPPFPVSRALFTAVAEELKNLKMDSNSDTDDIGFWKDLVCIGLSSKKISDALDECMKRATYNSLKIDADTFEPEEARGDYLEVCYEVGKSSLLPFMKSLQQKFSTTLKKAKGSRK